jgi:hypothetical protein
MLPQIVGPGTFTPSPFAPSTAERTAQGAQPAVGETAAAGARPEIANRVVPPRVIPPSLPLPDDRRRSEALLPPDPEAPAGPPPAFDATPLDRLRETNLAAAELLEEPPGSAPGAASPGDEAMAEAASGPLPEGAAGTRRPDPDASLRARAEAEVAEVRRMAEPGPQRSLDVTR